MSYPDICRYIGGALIALIGVALGLAGVQLWKGGPSAWPDIVADEVIVRRTAYALAMLAALHFITGLAAIRGVAWGGVAAAASLTLFVLLAFWGNYLLFGDLRLLHTGTNVVVAIIICALLWFGAPRAN